MFGVLTGLMAFYFAFCIYIQVLASDCHGDSCGIGYAIAIILWIGFAASFLLMWTQGLTFVLFINRFKSTYAAAFYTANLAAYYPNQQQQLQMISGGAPQSLNAMV